MVTSLADPADAMIDSLGDVGAALVDTRPERLSKLYDSAGLEQRYEPDKRAIFAATRAVVTP